MPIRSAGSGARLLDTGQTTCYHVGDDGDREVGVDKRYTTYTTGDYSGTKNIEVVHYAAATISFTAAGSVVADTALGLATFLAGDTVVIKGSVSNDGVYTVAVGGVAAQFTTVEAVVNELAGAYVKLYKRAAHSNNCVFDNNTRLWWSRYTSSAEKVGETSSGLLIWADVTKVYTIYSSANTISCVLPNIFRITGGAALTQFHVGDLIDLAGFATPANNLPGFYVTAVTPNGAALDITVDPSNQVLVAEGAVGDSIGLVCRSIFNYAAGANLIGLSGYTDWRIPNDISMLNLRDMEAPTATPDAVAFPGWPGTSLWSSTTTPSDVTKAQYSTWAAGAGAGIVKTTAYVVLLVRG